MLGLEGAVAQGADGEILPLNVGRLKVLSMGFFLKSSDEAVIWRGPMKMSVIKQFLKDTAWGELDYLIIDSPPGTGRRAVVRHPAARRGRWRRYCNNSPESGGRRCPQVGYVLPPSECSYPWHCGEYERICLPGMRQGDLCPSQRRRQGVFLRDMQVPFLGAIPIDPKISEACDNGYAFIDLYADTATAAAMREILKPIAIEG